MKDDFIIWSNINVDVDDYKEEILSEHPKYSKDEIIDAAYQINNDSLDDERCNLDKTLSGMIIVIGDLGLWDGRRKGYKMIPSNNIKDCLYQENDYCKFFVDKDGEFKAEGIHHDGTNYYTYRVFKKDATEEQIGDLKEKIYYNKCTQEDLDKVTDKIGPFIAEIYGFNLSKED